MTLRVLPVMIALNRATPELDVGIPVASSDAGLILALIAFTLTMFWRITTPLSVLPPVGSADGFRNTGWPFENADGMATPSALSIGSRLAGPSPDVVEYPRSRRSKLV